jgi:hypothetical protein
VSDPITGGDDSDADEGGDALDRSDDGDSDGAQSTEEGEEVEDLQRILASTEGDEDDEEFLDVEFTPDQDSPDQAGVEHPHIEQAVYEGVEELLDSLAAGLSVADDEGDAERIDDVEDEENKDGNSIDEVGEADQSVDFIDIQLYPDVLEGEAGEEEEEGVVEEIFH